MGSWWRATLAGEADLDIESRDGKVGGLVNKVDSGVGFFRGRGFIRNLGASAMKVDG